MTRKRKILDRVQENTRDFYFLVLELAEDDFVAFDLVEVDFFDLGDLVDLPVVDFFDLTDVGFFSVDNELSTTSNRLTWLFKRAALFL